MEREVCTQLELCDEHGGVARFCVSATDRRLFAITYSGAVTCVSLDDPSKVRRGLAHGSAHPWRPSGTVAGTTLDSSQVVESSG